MANFCLIPSQVQTFKEKLKSGEIDPAKLNGMSSAERRKFFEPIVGAENAKQVNTLFESKVLLKNQQKGMITWAKKVAGLKPEARRDLVDRVNKMETVLNPKEADAFLEDIVAQRLGVGVTMAEAGRISELAKVTSETKAAIPENAPIGSKERLEYGFATTEFKDFVGGLKAEANKPRLREYLNPLKTAKSLSGVAKSILASLDNSFFGRQGIKVIANNPVIWSKNFAKSWVDIARQLGGRDAMQLIKADVFSRPNAINGKYDAMKVAVGLKTEEAFPSSVPERIPGIRRLFKASEAAFNGAALRMRADLADKYIANLEKAGVNVLSNKAEAVAHGKLINSMTGRGHLGKGEAMAETVNATLFSGRFLKSNIDTLTLHAFDKNITPRARRQAAMNSLRTIGFMSSVLTISEILHPGSVEKDPRGNATGKITVGDTTFDITGGMGSIITLAARLVPTRHNGEWGFWSKNSKTGKFTKLGVGYGTDNPLDLMWSFLEGKASPAASLVRDLWKQEDMQGNPITPTGLVTDRITPIAGQSTYDAYKNPNSAGALAVLIADGLGIGANTRSIGEVNWNKEPGVELKAFRDKVGQGTFDEANREYNKLIGEESKKITEDDRYKDLSDEDKQKVMTKKKDEIKDSIFKKHNFKYKKKEPAKLPKF